VPGFSPVFCFFRRFFSSCLCRCWESRSKRARGHPPRFVFFFRRLYGNPSCPFRPFFPRSRGDTSSFSGPRRPCKFAAAAARLFSLRLLAWQPLLLHCVHDFLELAWLDILFSFASPGRRRLSRFVFRVKCSPGRSHRDLSPPTFCSSWRHPSAIVRCIDSFCFHAFFFCRGRLP